jgi:hypothetical protein
MYIKKKLVVPKKEKTSSPWFIYYSLNLTFTSFKFILGFT